LSLFWHELIRIWNKIGAKVGKYKEKLTVVVNKQLISCCKRCNVVISGRVFEVETGLNQVELDLFGAAKGMSGVGVVATLAWATDIDAGQLGHGHQRDLGIKNDTE